MVELYGNIYMRCFWEIIIVFIEQILIKNLEKENMFYVIMFVSKKMKK